MNWRRSKEDRKLGDVLKEMISAYRLTEKLDEVDVRKFWKQCLGNSVNNLTSKLYLNKGKLFVKVDSASLRNELMMLRTRLVEEINRNAGRAIIDEVVIL